MVQGADFAEFSLLIDLGVIVITATLFNLALKKLRQPSILAYLLAGLVLGIGLNHALSACVGVAVGDTCFGLPSDFFGISKKAEMQILSELGIAFLLFSVGIETDFSKLKRIGRTIFLGTVLQVFLTIALTVLFFQFLGLLSFAESLVLGMVLAFSSTLVVVKILSDKYEIDTLHGGLMVGMLLIQDVLIILLLPLVSNLDLLFSASHVGSLVVSSLTLIVTAFVLAQYVFPRLYEFSSKSNELLFLSALSTAFGFMFFSFFFLGLPLALGAFVAGVSLSRLPYHLQIYDEIRGVRDFFVTVFFATLGINLSLQFTFPSLPLLLAVLAILFVLKPLVFYVLTLLSGYGGRIALLVGLGLGQVSEFSLILANQALAKNAISPQLYTVSVIALMASMLATPYFFRHRDFLYHHFQHLTSHVPVQLKHPRFFSKVKSLEEEVRLKGHVVIAGGGVIGLGLAHALSKKADLALLDQNPKTVHFLQKKGFRAYYGQATNKTILDKINLAEAKVLAITIPDFEAGLQLAQYAKSINQGIRICARAHDQHEAVKYYQAGADFVSMPEALASRQFVHGVKEALGNGRMERGIAASQEFASLIRDFMAENEGDVFKDYKHKAKGGGQGK